MIVEEKNVKRDDAITNEPVFECLWPLGPAASGKIEPARRIADLSGKTVGELWDGLFHGDIMLAGIREELSKRFPGVKFVGYDRFGDIHGPKRNEVLARMPTLLKELYVDAVISCVGA